MSVKLDKLTVSQALKDKILGVIGEYLVNETKKNITANHQIDTGMLRNSITYQIDGNDLYVGTNLEYAIYQELGTGLFAVNNDGRTDVPWRYVDDDGNWHTTCGIHPKPFLQPALDNNKQKIQEMVKKIIIEELGGKP